MADLLESAHLNDGFWVGDWLVQPLRNRISKNDDERPLEPKVMEVLVCMARRPQKTVTKDQFMDEVWGGTVVTDDVLSRCISELRKTFEDDSRNPHVIETIRKTGYRLIARVRIPDPGSDVDTEVFPTADEEPERISPPSTREPTALASPHQRLRRVLTRPLVRTSLLGVLVVLVIAALIFQYSQPPRLTDPPIPRPFTSSPGMELDAAVSPTGQQVAFAWDNETGRDYDIYLKQAGAETPLRLTYDPGDERHPAWSPDGLRLAFVRSSNEKNVIFTVSSIGGPSRQIADLGGRQVRDLAWSPDGRTLGVAAQTTPYGVSGIYLLAVDSSTVEQLTFPPTSIAGGQSLSFSPDGRSLAFVRAVTDEIQDIFVVSLDGGEPRQITFDSTAVSGLDWTGDGGQIVFTSRRAGISALWRMDPSGGEPVWIVSAAGDSRLEHPSVAREGPGLVFVERASDPNIWRLWREQETEPFRAHPLIFSTRWDSNPDISPDGDRIAYSSNQSGHREIWLCDRSGSNHRQLTNSEGEVAGIPRWSPDGGRIALVARSEGRTEIRIIDTMGRVIRRLPTSPADETVASWSRDASHIYYASEMSGRPEIWTVPSDSGRALQVTGIGARVAIESPDGTTLYFIRSDTSGIWRIPLVANDAVRNRPELVVGTLHPSDWGNWRVAPDGIYYVERGRGDPVLMFMPFDGEEAVAVTTLRNVPGPASLAVAPDRTWILYTQVDDMESDIMLIEQFR